MRGAYEIGGCPTLLVGLQDRAGLCLEGVWWRDWGREENLVTTKVGAFVLGQASG